MSQTGAKISCPLAGQCTTQLGPHDSLKWHLAAHHAIYDENDANAITTDPTYISGLNKHSLAVQVMRDQETANNLKAELLNAERRVVAQGAVTPGDICKTHQTADTHVRYLADPEFHRLRKPQLVARLVKIRGELYGANGAATLQQDISAVEAMIKHDEGEDENAAEDEKENSRDYEADGRAYAEAAYATAALIEAEKKM